MSNDILIVVSEDGSRSVSIYDDDLDFGHFGEYRIERASHVEWSEEHGFYADLTPSGGPLLTGFKKYRDAVEAELRWLDEHLVDIV
jgi:hypothetical protein